MKDSKQTAEILQLVQANRVDPCDTHCDAPCDKVDKYYNKENKYNKHNSSATPLCETSSEEQSKEQEIHTEEDIDSGSPLESVSAAPDELGWQTEEDVLQASIQYYVNPRTRKNKKETRNLKLQIKSKADGYLDFTARLNKDITSLKRYGTNVSAKHQEQIFEYAMQAKEQILYDFPGSVVYMGKFKESGNWITDKAQLGAIEEGTLGIVWFDHSAKLWRYLIMFQHWMSGDVMSKDLKESQRCTNMIAQHIYYPDLKMKKLSRTQRRRAALLAEKDK